jgi:hypothetical protein
MNMRSTLLVLVFLLAAAFRGNAQGYLVPGGITAFESTGWLKVDVIQNPTNRDYTCFDFMSLGTNTFAYLVCLNDGVRTFYRLASQ